MHKHIRDFVSVVFGLILAATASASTRVATGNLNIPRAGHTATLLPNGKVLVAGGCDGNGNLLDSAELYDPNDRTWRITGHLNAARCNGAATLLPTGQVLVVGGANDRVIAELYDPNTGTWTPTGAPSTNRFYHTATLLKTGKVLLVGGVFSGCVKVAELYDPATGIWSRTGNPIGERALHGAMLLQDGRVLVMGGTCDSDFLFPLNTSELYDPIAGTWSSTATLIGARHSHTATLLSNGKVMVAGGYGDPYQIPPGSYTTPSASCTVGDVRTNSSELYDPAAARWDATGSLISAVAGPTATLLLDGDVLIAGTVLTDDGIEDSRGELYDTVRGAWDYTSATNSARHDHTATLLQNGNVLIAGGYGEGILNSAELYESGGPSTPPARPIGAGFTGSWFNPEQSGHGIALEVLPGQPRRLLASWFTFAPNGDQAWIVGFGPITGNRVVLQGFQTVGSGGRSPPNFDATNVHQETWGTLTFTFSDCNHGRVEWAATAPGYGTGGLDLTRLTLPAGLTCQ